MAKKTAKKKAKPKKRKSKGRNLTRFSLAECFKLSEKDMSRLGDEFNEIQKSTSNFKEVIKKLAIKSEVDFMKGYLFGRAVEENEISGHAAMFKEMLSHGKIIPLRVQRGSITGHIIR